MGNELVKCEAMNGNEGVFFSMANFEGAQRMAKMLAESDIVPETYKRNIPNTVIALEMANRIGASPLAVMQNLYIVYGKPAWSSQFLISCINASGRFSPLRYDMSGEGDDHGCIAWAVDRSNERLESPRITIGMAKAEGWFTKNGSKWKTMPDLMLRYRAATLFARLYAPELTMGIHTDDEVIDITPIVTEPVNRKSPLELPLPSKTETTITPLEAATKAAEIPPVATKGKKEEKSVEAVPVSEVAELLKKMNAPVTVADVENYLRAKNKLGKTQALSQDKKIEELVIKNISSIASQAADWKQENF